MFCQKCGKFIDYDAPTCRECVSESTPATSVLSSVTYVDVTNQAQAAGFPEPTNRMFGFGKALCSAILGDFAVAFAYVAMMLGFNSFGAIIAVVLLLLSAALGGVSLVQGIASINCFNRRKTTCAKPVPTLILGIAGTVWAACAFIVMFCAIIVIIAGLL